MPGQSSSVVLGAEVAAAGTGPSAWPLPAATVAAAAPAAAASERRPLKYRCLGGRCIPFLRWHKVQRPSKIQKQQKQLQELPYQQQVLDSRAQQRKPLRHHVEQRLQLQYQLHLQQQRPEQLLQHGEQNSHKQTWRGQQQLHQQQERQERRLMLLLGSVDTTGLSTPCTRGGSSTRSKAVCLKDSGISVGINVSTPATPGCSSSHSSGDSSSSTSSNDCSSGGSRGRQQPFRFSSPACSTLGPHSLDTGTSLESSMNCSEASSRRGSHNLVSRSSRGSSEAEAAPLLGRGTSAGSRCSADAAPATNVSISALVSASTAAATAPCAAAGLAAGAHRHTSGEGTSLASKTATVLPTVGLLTGGATRLQFMAAGTTPENPAVDANSGAATRPTSIAGPAVDATAEWGGPDLLDATAYRKDWNRQPGLPQPQKQSEEQRQPALQEQHRLALREQHQREHLRSTGGHCVTASDLGTPYPSRLSSRPSQATDAADAAAPPVAAMATREAAPGATPPYLASKRLEPSAPWRPASSIGELHSDPQQHRTQLEDSEIPALPLLGGRSSPAPMGCSSSVLASAAVVNETDDKCRKHPGNTSPVLGGGQPRAAAAAAAVEASLVGGTVAPGSGDLTTVAAVAKEISIQRPVETRQKLLDRHQKRDEHGGHPERQRKVQSPPLQQGKQVQRDRLGHCSTPSVGKGPQISQLPPDCHADRYGRSTAGPSTSGSVSAGAAIELAAEVLDDSAATAKTTIGPSAEALVSTVTQKLSSLLATGPPGCSMGVRRRQQHLTQQQNQLRQQEAGQQHGHLRVQQRSIPLFPSPSNSRLQKQLRPTRDQHLHQQVLQEQRLEQRAFQQKLLKPPAAHMPVKTSCTLQQLHALELYRQQQRQQHQLFLQRLLAPTLPAPQTEHYATTRSESPTGLPLRMSPPSKKCQMHHQLLLLHEQQQRQIPPEKQLIEMQRTFFGVRLSEEAEAAAAYAAGAAAAAAASRPLCGNNIVAPFDRVLPPHQYQLVKQHQAISEVHQPEFCPLQQLQPIRGNSVKAVVSGGPAPPSEDILSPYGSHEEPNAHTPLPEGLPRTVSPACACPSPQPDGPVSGRRSPAGQQAAEASRRALLLRKNSQASLLNISGAASHIPELHRPQPSQQQALWETGGTSAVPLAAAAAAITASVLGQSKLEGRESSPTDLGSNSTNVTSDMSSASSVHSALTPHLLHPSRQTPFPLEQPGVDIEHPSGGAATVAERPPTPVRAERLRKRLEMLRDMGQLSRDTYPAAEVVSLISGARVEKDGPFPVYVLDKDWSLGCSALDPDWPQKMLQNTKEGIKLHSEINRLLALAKEVDLAQAKKGV